MNDAFAYSTIEEYEELVGFKVNEAFRTGWIMARTMNSHLFGLVNNHMVWCLANDWNGSKPCNCGSEAVLKQPIPKSDNQPKRQPEDNQPRAD